MEMYLSIKLVTNMFHAMQRNIEVSVFLQLKIRGGGRCTNVNVRSINNDLDIIFKQEDNTYVELYKHCFNGH